MPHNKGGRIPPDNRGPQAKGVGKNSKRHDLERRSVPYLHGSDLQQGDVQALRQGQRVAPKQNQQPAAPRPAQRGGRPSGTGPGTTEIPDPIQFISQLAGGGGVNPPPAGIASNGNADMWLRFARHLVNGPGSSGMLAGAYINQMRQLRKSAANASSVFINLPDVDTAIEAALDEQANA